MKTFVIDIPDAIYDRGIRYAKEHGITFSELCELGVMNLMRLSEEELLELVPQQDKNNQDV